ncbi:MAG TPA: beta-ketoacyl-ACP synthase III [Thermoanaerobaculia bacterium]|jgi:3-oxoacyl-[acyl-carrier-protein] synthase-3|nr:beta-ketoacyl-ACP synthase III [Thermoanaerobaculia bacterium]
MSARDAAPIGILGLGAYVPERVMTNADWSRYVDTTDEWIRERTGIERRRVAAPEQSTVDLALPAARLALEEAGIGPHEIDEIIVATDTPEVYIPDTAAFVQQRLGAREVPAYDLAGSGCAGFLQALDVARSRVLAGAAGRVLVIGVELLTRLMSWSDRNTCVLFGDAAGAAVVGASARAAEILAAVAGTDGSAAGILALEAGGTRVPFNEEAARLGLHHKIDFHGREVFRHAVRRMAQAGREVLARAGRAIEEVALLVPHQANLRILDAVRRELELPEEKVYVNVQEYGNTGSASVPLALWEARRAGRVGAGDLVLLVSFGAGFHWAGVLLRYP